MIDPDDVILSIEADLWHAFINRCPEGQRVIDERPPLIVLPNADDLKIRA